MARQHRPVEVTESVDDLLLNIIDDTLKHVFKEAGTNVIYGYLGNKCHLNRDEIAEKPEVFSTGLKNLLGSGALLIEKMILRNLYTEFQLRFREEKDYDLADYIAELRKKVLSRSVPRANPRWRWEP